MDHSALDSGNRLAGIRLGVPALELACDRVFVVHGSDSVLRGDDIECAAAESRDEAQHRMPGDARAAGAFGG